jgi:hypothetical protein
MTHDELIELIRRYATIYSPDQVATFEGAVAEEIEFLRGNRRQHDQAEDSRVSRERSFKEELGIPTRYAATPELWATFTVFVTQFIDPVRSSLAATQYAADSFDLAGGRIVFVNAAEAGAESSEASTEELDSFEIESLSRDVHSLVSLADVLGREAFGEVFRIADFIPGEGDAARH